MELSTMLRDLAESPAPPTTVDIGRATSAGRRTVRLRRGLAAGSAALAVAVLAGAIAVVGGGGGSALPNPPLPAATATAEPTNRALPDQAPAAFDPMVQYADLGSVPVGSTARMVTVSHTWMSVELSYFGGPTSDGGDRAPGSISLFVAAAGYGVDAERGFDHAVPIDDLVPGLDVPDVNGARAEFVSARGGFGLRWEYAPRAWAMVVAANLGELDLKNTARHVAENVVFGANAPISLPFRTNAVPADLSVRVVSVSRTERGQRGAFVYYGTDAGRVGGDWPLAIQLVWSTAESGDGAVIGDPTTTVDGYPARSSTLLDGGSGLQLFNVKGFYIELLTHSAATTASLNGGLVGLFRSMELRPDLAQ